MDAIEYRTYGLDISATKEQLTANNKTSNTTMDDAYDLCNQFNSSSSYTPGGTKHTAYPTNTQR